MVDFVRGHHYDKPLTKMRELPRGDGQGRSTWPRGPPRSPGACSPPSGPKMLELAAAKALGAHPYFVPVEHTAFAREVLGDGPMLCPEQAVVLATDPDEARAAARLHMATYLTLPNYTNNLRRLGWGDDDLGDGGSDALVDAIVAWGDEEAIVGRVQAHLDAGADHVCVQVLRPTTPPRCRWSSGAGPGGTACGRSDPPPLDLTRGSRSRDGGGVAVARARSTGWALILDVVPPALGRDRARACSSASAGPPAR